MTRPADATVFGVLGTLSVQRAGAEVPLTSGRQRTVLAALLAASGRTVPADELVAAAWGERWPENPRAALHTVLSRLRGALGRELVSADAGGYRLAVPPDAVDAARFEALLHRGAQAPPAAGAQLLAAALALWRGPAFAEFTDRDFAVTEARRLERLRADCVERYAERALALGNAAPAIEHLESLLAAEPWRERAVALLMRSLHAAGRPVDALDRYRRYRTQLADELGLDPTGELAELERRIMADELPGDPGRHAPEPPGWVISPSAFIGREDELAALRDAVCANRLVTVTGLGGVGKTRLVAEALADIAQLLAAPVSIVELAAVRRSGVAAAVAAALGLENRPASVREAIMQYLGVGARLVVVDNCEHVRNDVRDLMSAIVRRCPGVRVLATSRQPLHLAAEQVLPLDPLPTSVPDDAALPAAQRLLVDRLRRRRPAFALTEQTLPLVAQICRQLDGVPLAIELAATHAAVLGLRDVAEQPMARLGALADEGAGMRAVLERSYALLEPDDRRLFDALSVFSTDFDLDAVHHLAAGPAEPLAAIHLARLVDASLVTVTHRAGAVRYRLLGLVRAFAAAQLERDPAVARRTRAAHARWVCALAETAAGAALTSDTGAHYQRLELARADVLGAIHWALAAGEPDLAARITSALRLFPHWRPDAEALTLIRRVADHPGVRGCRHGVLAVGAAAIAAVDVGDLDDAYRLGEEALALAVSPNERYLALVALAVAALYRGRHGESTGHWRRLLDTPGLAPAQRIDASASLALLACYGGDLPGARGHAEHLLRMVHETPESGYHAFARYATAEVVLIDDPAGAIDLLERAVAAATTARADQIAAVAQIAQVSALVRLGRYAAAGSAFPALLEQLRRRGNWPQLWTALRILAELLDARGRPEAAALLLAAADHDPAAPILSGNDIERYRELGRRIGERIGAPANTRIGTIAQALTRTQLLDEAWRALAAG